jgi:hypothetical protein
VRTRRGGGAADASGNCRATRTRSNQTGYSPTFLRTAVTRFGWGAITMSFTS